MDDSVPAIQPRPAIAPAGASRDRRRRRRRARDERSRAEAPTDLAVGEATAPPNTGDHRSLDADIGRAAPGEPGTNLDLTA